MRAFIALPLPSNIKESLAHHLGELKDCGVPAKWVKPDNLHITLKFLGEAGEEKLGEIKRILLDLGKRFVPFSIRFKDFGFFPNAKEPRIFFLSTDEEERLKNIVKIMEEKLEVIGFPKENRFKSHITLARIREVKNIGRLKEKIKDIPLKERFLVQTITLFKSTLTKSGPIYEDIFKASLTS